MRTEQLKAGFAANNFDYVVATYGASPAALDYLEKNIGKGTRRSAMRSLASPCPATCRARSWSRSTIRWAPSSTRTATVIGFERERAMTAMLDSATERAKERIAAVDKAGGDSSMPIIIFQAGRAARDGSLKEKIAALGDFWKSSTYARLLTLLAAPALP